MRTRKDLIVSALLSGQKNIHFGKTEILLEPLARDTQKRKEIEAESVASGIVQLLKQN